MRFFISIQGFNNDDLGSKASVLKGTLTRLSEVIDKVRPPSVGER